MHWFYDPTFTQRSTELTKDEGKHLAALRIQPGEEIVVTDGRGQSFTCEVEDPRSGNLTVTAAQGHEKPAISIHLVQALAKGGRDEMAVQAAVELGVASITPWEGANSVANWRGKEEKGLQRWQQIAISAMKQSQQAYLPEVRPLSSNPELLGEGIALEPSSLTPLSQAPAATEYTVVVGPEGGFTQKELEELKVAGFGHYRLGHSVLRTSSAGPAAISALLTLRGSW
jgi:16S rRNA (uracil1498-N3)-methyltransferase